MILVLDTEDAVWTSLRQVLSGEIKASEVEGIDFQKADWARFRYKLNGKKFNQSLTASTMSGIIEFQNSLYKSASLLIKEDGRISKLTDREKAELELIFLVKKGSSDVDAEAKGTLVELATALSKKMTGKQLLIAILVLAGMYFGVRGVSVYFDFEAGNIKTSEQHQELKDLMKHDEDIVKIVKEAGKKSEYVSEIQKQNFEAFESLVKRADQSDGIELQGRSISKSTVDQINRQTRRTAREAYFKERVQILSVDSSNARGYTVRMEIIDDGTIVNVAVDDPVVIERSRRILQDAEWGKFAINAEFSGRQIGSEVQNAKLVRAWRIRTRKG